MLSGSKPGEAASHMLDSVFAPPFSTWKSYNGVLKRLASSAKPFDKMNWQGAVLSIRLLKVFLS